MSMARLFYHLPKYAVLDESSSAVSTDVEGSMYQAAKDAGISAPSLLSPPRLQDSPSLLHPALITISHRPSLFKHHMYLLTLTGVDGAWELKQIGEHDASLSFKKEIEVLEEKLAEVESWKKRLAEVDRELHFET
jgi:ATP-binding cassette subfamily D (ALD) long-chain fatty acid import protein